MKKLVILLLILMLCLSLAACGGDKETSNNSTQINASSSQQETEPVKNESSSQQETEPVKNESSSQQETEPVKVEDKNDEPQLIEIEITLENLYEYFEIVPHAELVKDSFGDIESGFVNAMLVLKDEYFDYVIETGQGGFAIEYNYSDTIRSVEYNIATGEYTTTEMGADAIANKGYKLQSEIGTTTREFLTSHLIWEKERGGHGIVNSLEGQGSPIGDSFGIEDGIATWDSHYPIAEVTRIKGTLYMEK